MKKHALNIFWALFLLILGAYVLSGSTPSPYSSFVLVHHGNYLEIQVPETFTGIATSSSWTLQIQNTEQRFPLGKGTSTFRHGAINNESVVLLQARDRMYITSGPSPVGISFQVSTCSGYLAQFQSFTPSLRTTCPQPNTSNLDPACNSFIASIPQCTAVFNNPSVLSLSASCKRFIVNTLNHNACQETLGSLLPEWRVYISNLPELSESQKIDLYDEYDQLIGTFSARDK